MRYMTRRLLSWGKIRTAFVIATAVLLGGASAASATVGDEAAPVVVSVSDPVVPPPTGGPREVTVDVHVTDDLSGVEQVSMFFLNPGSPTQGIDGGGFVGRETQLLSGDARDGVYRVTLIVSVFQGAGQWCLHYLTVVDRVQNAHTALPGTPCFTVPTNPDNDPPTIVAISQPTPATVTADNPDEYPGFYVDLHLTDALAGVTVPDDLSGGWQPVYSAVQFFNSTSHIASGYVRDRLSGDRWDGMYRVYLYLPPMPAAGSWCLFRVAVVDGAGNRNSVDSDRFGQVCVDVISPYEDSVAPRVLAIDDVAPRVDLSTADGFLTGTVRATDGIGDGVPARGDVFGTITYTSSRIGTKLTGYFSSHMHDAPWAAEGNYPFRLNLRQYTRTGEWCPTYWTAQDQSGNSSNGNFDPSSGDCFVVNTPPTEVDQALATSQGVALPITLGAFDPDTGDAVTFTPTAPSHGTLTGTGPNFVYTPDPGFYGTDGFDFTASDGLATSDTGHVSIAVNGIPIGASDAYTVSEDDAVEPSVGVLANDTDPEDAALHAVLVSGPSHGTLDSLNDDGTFRYTPAPDYAGPDSFTYAVSDGQAQSAPVTVSIEVVGDPLIATQIATPPATVQQTRGTRTLTLTATLTDASGVALAGQVVRFTASDLSCDGVTNTAGVASCTVSPPAAQGALLRDGYTATYAGGPDYAGTSGRGKINANRGSAPNGKKR